MDEIDRARERERGGRDGDGLVRMACFVSVSLGETVDPRCWSCASRLRARRAAAHGRGANAPGPSVKSGHGHRAGSPLITYLGLHAGHSKQIDEGGWCGASAYGYGPLLNCCSG